MRDKFDWRTCIKANAETPQNVLIALDKYFEPFAQPKMAGNTVIDGNPCLKCGGKLNPDLISSFIGLEGFTWGIAHGEGHCIQCQWPARSYHFIKDENGEELMTIRNFIIQYHPDHVSVNVEKRDD